MRFNLFKGRFFLIPHLPINRKDVGLHEVFATKHKERRIKGETWLNMTPRRKKRICVSRFMK